MKIVCTHIKKKPFQTKGEKDWGFIKNMGLDDTFWIEGNNREARDVSEISLLRRYARSVDLKVRARKFKTGYDIYIS